MRTVRLQQRHWTYYWPISLFLPQFNPLMQAKLF